MARLPEAGAVSAALDVPWGKFEAKKQNCCRWRKIGVTDCSLARWRLLLPELPRSDMPARTAITRHLALIMAHDTDEQAFRIPHSK
jgi:hypothetical protein